MNFEYNCGTENWLLRIPEMKWILKKRYLTLSETIPLLEALCLKYKSFKKMAENVYICDDYWINLGRAYDLEKNAASLSKARRLNAYVLACIPRFVCYNTLRDYNAVLITEMPGTDHITPIPYNVAMQGNDLITKARCRFYKEICCMIDREMVAPEFLDKPSFPEDLLYVPSTDTLVWTDWSDMTVIIGDETIADYKKKLCDKLGIKWIIDID